MTGTVLICRYLDNVLFCEKLLRQTGKKNQMLATKLQEQGYHLKNCPCFKGLIFSLPYFQGKREHLRNLQEINVELGKVRFL